MGAGFRLDDSMGSLTCNIGCSDLTASYVSTRTLYAPAIEAKEDGSGNQIVLIGDENTRSIYVKYDSTNSVMKACFTELTCG